MRAEVDSTVPAIRVGVSIFSATKVPPTVTFSAKREPRALVPVTFKLVVASCPETVALLVTSSEPVLTLSVVTTGEISSLVAISDWASSLEMRGS